MRRKDTQAELNAVKEQKLIRCASCSQEFIEADGVCDYAGRYIGSLPDSSKIVVGKKWRAGSCMQRPKGICPNCHACALCKEVGYDTTRCCALPRSLLLRPQTLQKPS